MKIEKEINCGSWMNNWDEHEQLTWQIVKHWSTQWQSGNIACHLLERCVLGGCKEMFSLALSQWNSARANGSASFWVQQ